MRFFVTPSGELREWAVFPTAMSSQARVLLYFYFRTVLASRCRNTKSYAKRARPSCPASSPRPRQMFGWKKDEVKAVVDVDIMDEAAGKARLTMAAASKERRQLEAKAQAERAASQKKINQNAGQRTDDDIMDEEAGRARITLAAESKARKARDAQELARKNAEMKEKLKKVTAKTDDDVDDEAAGEMRKKLAAESTARRLEQERLAKERHEAMVAKLKATGVRTDDDIMDEAAGRFRLELASASEARRAEEYRQRTIANAELRVRYRVTPTRVLSPPRYTVEPPSEEEVAATLAAVSEARAAAARFKDKSGGFLTQDQINTRRRFASQSKRTSVPGSQLIVSPSAYKTTIGIRQAALYRQESAAFVVTAPGSGDFSTGDSATEA